MAYNNYGFLAPSLKTLTRPMVENAKIKTGTSNFIKKLLKSGNLSTLPSLEN